MSGNFEAWINDGEKYGLVGLQVKLEGLHRSGASRARPVGFSQHYIQYSAKLATMAWQHPCRAACRIQFVPVQQTTFGHARHSGRGERTPETTGLACLCRASAGKHLCARPPTSHAQRLSACRGNRHTAAERFRVSDTVPFSIVPAGHGRTYSASGGTRREAWRADRDAASRRSLAAFPNAPCIYRRAHNARHSRPSSPIQPVHRRSDFARCGKDQAAV